MAAYVQADDRSEQVTPSRTKESISELFIPKDTLDQPCDVVLMVKGGRQFKAHRRVLSEASPFFEKLLNSDMKEAQDGVVRLEMFTEPITAATLQFIYTGDVQILAEDTARDLIVVADYLFLEKLKRLAGGVLVQTLTTSNCISTYYFAERYQCEYLLWNTKKFLLANFVSIYAASRADILNMSRRETEMWISSDEINVSAEEDVFDIILAWIEHDRNRRKRYFVELFNHVRLTYVSRDFLRHDIVTNELVQENNSCLRLVNDAICAINSFDPKNFYSFSVPPRKSLGIPAVVVNVGENIVCYFPRQKIWCKLGGIPAELITYHKHDKFVPCNGRLYSTVRESLRCQPQSLKQLIYNPYSNKCVLLPSLKEPRRYLRKTFVRNGDEMYALMSEPCVMDHLVNWRFPVEQQTPDSCRTKAEQKCGSRKHTSFLTKYKPESNSWEDVSSFDHLDLRQDFCIVAKNDFIYFIGGIDWHGIGNECRFLSDVDRYDVSRNKWNKLADIQMARTWAHGTAVREKIYIAGGVFKGSRLPESCQCEMYDEATNEWQFITSFKIRPGRFEALLAVDGELYASSITDDRQRGDFTVRLECYKPEENKWETKTEVTTRRLSAGIRPPTNACSMRLFKGIFNILLNQQVDEAYPIDGNLSGAGTTQPSLTSKNRERKCFIM